MILKRKSFPALSSLPDPTVGNTGWPWTREPPAIPDIMPDGKPWPKISIVTPSFNQDQFIEETMRSVLLQGYPNLEYIIIDGGSDDGTIDIISKYEHNLAYWVSETDRGQANAINKGFGQATGEIFAWINSDDYYYPGVLGTVAQTFATHPEIALAHGYEHYVDEKSNVTHEVRPVFRNARIATLYLGHPVLQLTCFWRSEAYRAVGGLDETLRCHLDYDFLLRLSYWYPSIYVPLCVGAFRRYAEQKSKRREECRTEYNMVVDRFLAQLEISAWKRSVLSYWLRVLFLWRYKEVSGPVSILRKRLHQAVTLMKSRLSE